MKTAAQIVNDAKVRIQQDIIARLRAGGKESRQNTWRRIELDQRLWKELGSYDLTDRERRAHLNKVSFPDANHTDVDAALNAGNNLNQLYLLACGRAFIPKDSTGSPIAGKKGLKILRPKGLIG